MIRLALPLAGGVLFFLLSLVTVRPARPRAPRSIFLTYGIATLAGSIVADLRRVAGRRAYEIRL